MTEPDDQERRERAAILARRQRFVSAALTGITTSTLATACACLNVATEAAPVTPDDGAEAEEPTAVEGADAPAPEEGADDGEAAAEGAEEPAAEAAADSAE
ncbi:MAG: hypothetical protein AAF799_15285 [Myxococcota bacterium]